MPRLRSFSRETRARPPRIPKRSFDRHDARQQCRQDEASTEMRLGGKGVRCARNDHRQIDLPKRTRPRAGAAQDRKRGSSCGCERNDRRKSRAGQSRRSAHTGRRTARESTGIPMRYPPRTSGASRPSCPDPSSCASHPTVLPLLHFACRRTADRFSRPRGRRKLSVTDAFCARQPGKPGRHARGCAPVAIDRQGMTKTGGRG